MVSRLSPPELNMHSCRFAQLAISLAHLLIAMSYMAHIVDAVQVLVAGLIIKITSPTPHDVEGLIVAECSVWAIVFAPELKYAGGLCRFFC